MSDQRRYDDDEVREIFGAAAEAPDTGVRGSLAPAASHGFTLAELKEIGSEAGLSPARIAEAAAALDLPKDLAPARRTLVGLPLSVGQVVALPRAPTDREWERLVAELRETFGARGRVGEYGRMREWTHSNLHAYVEPTETGYRLRLGTTKGNAAPRLLAGLALLAMAMLVFFTGETAAVPFGTFMLSVMGLGMAGSVAVELPRWARRREEQMAYIAGRTLEMLAAPSDAAAG